VVAGLGVLVPVFVHGRVLGPFDLLAFIGLTKQPGVGLHIYQNPDLIDSLIPWTTIAWHQVHQGHLPIWNPYSGLGMPLAFNWQTAPFALPALVGYLAPVRDAFTVGVATNIVVAGTGAYLLGRVLGMGVVASAAAGTIFELSGPFVAWLGYPFPSVMCWAGWMFAVGLLLLRGRHRAGYTVALAVIVALSLYGGAPEGFAVLMVAVTVFFVVALVSRAEWAGGAGPILIPGLNLLAAAVAGTFLAAPFALPGIQLTAGSVRSSYLDGGLLPGHTLVYLALQGFDGLPIFHHGRVVVFGPTVFYSETAMYVGITALVLAGLAIFRKHRQPEVRGFALVIVVCLALVFVPPIVTLAYKLPLLGRVDWVRALMPFALALAVLAGYGLDLVVRAVRLRDTARWLGVGFAIAGFALACVWLFGRGHLSPAQASVRAHSFIWPAVETAAGLGIAGFLLWASRPRHRPGTGVSDIGRPAPRAPRPGPWSRTIAALGLLTVLTAFLISAGATMIEWSQQSFPQTPASKVFVSEVGSSTVAFASFGCLLGLAPNINGVYGVHELGVYDPIIPKKYFTAWPIDTGTAAGSPGLNTFCPAVTTASVAREFGVGYILTKAGKPAPAGTTYVRQMGGEVLYRVGGSGEATVTPMPGGVMPANDVVGTPVAVHHPGPSEWRIVTDSNKPQALRLHLTDVPGWHASIDGKPLALETYAGMMLQARIGPGRHIIVLHYWPQTFTVGIVLALLSAVALVALLLIASHRKRGVRLGRPGPSDAEAHPS
jgi:hypothetical protein